MQYAISAFAALVLLPVVLAGCGGATSVTQLGGPSGVRCQTDVSGPSSGVASAGGNLNVSVAAARECTWSAAAEASWLTVSPTDGQGDGAIVVTVAPNPQPNARTGRVVVNGTRVTITQNAAGCRFELSGTNGHVGHTGGRTSVDISGLSGCGWQASSGASWIEVRTRSGSGSGRIELDIAPNAGATRSGTVTIAGLSFTVTQEGAPGGGPSSGDPPGSPPPGPPAAGPAGPPQTCVFTLSPSARSFERKGGDGSFRVVTGDGCTWTVSTPVPWITIRSGHSGSGSGEVRYRVDENPAPAPRATSIVVAGERHAVSQDAGRTQKIEVEGRVGALSGSCPNLSFKIGRWSVVTDSRTKFDDGNCRDVRNGIEVEVEGDVIGENVMRAREVELD